MFAAGTYSLSRMQLARGFRTRNTCRDNGIPQSKQDSYFSKPRKHIQTERERTPGTVLNPTYGQYDLEKTTTRLTAMASFTNCVALSSMTFSSSFSSASTSTSSSAFTVTSEPGSSTNARKNKSRIQKEKQEKGLIIPMDPNSLSDVRIARCKSRSLAATNQTTIAADEASFRSLNPNSSQQCPFSHHAISINPFTQHHPSLPSYHSRF